MTRTSTPKILIVLTSHAELGATKKKTGAYLPELTHPHAVFRAAGFEVDFASVKGGAAPLDGVDRQDPVNAAFLDGHAGFLKARAVVTDLWRETRASPPSPAGIVN